MASTKPDDAPLRKYNFADGGAADCSVRYDLTDCFGEKAVVVDLFGNDEGGGARQEGS